MFVFQLNIRQFADTKGCIDVDRAADNSLIRPDYIGYLHVDTL